MASIDQNIRTYLIAIEIEGKTPRTIPWGGNIHPRYPD